MTERDKTLMIWGKPIGQYATTSVVLDQTTGEVTVSYGVDRMNVGSWQFYFQKGRATVGDVMKDVKKLYLPELPDEACDDKTVIVIG